MAYTETTRTSYGQRLKSSIGGVFIGILMFIGGTIILWYNEGRTVKTRDMLNDAQKNCVEMEDPSVKDNALNGKLVHAKAFADTKDSLVDPTFKIGAVAVKLNSNVEYYQWVEHSKSESKDKIGGGKETVTTYTYSKEWTSSPVNSDSFHDPDYFGRNFVNFNANNTNIKAKNVTFGAYRLNPSQVGSFHNPEPVDVVLDKEFAANLNRVCADKKNNTAALDSTGFRYVHTTGNVLYLGQNPNSPEIGDVRITFTKDMPANVSLIAKVDGDTFSEYKSSNGKMFSSLAMGEKSMDEMFAQEHSTNNAWKWILRILGIALVIMGLKNMFGVLPALFKIIPFLGSIANAGVGLVASLLGLAWSLIVIAIAWLVYHPLYGIILLLIAGGLIFLLVKKASSKKNSSPVVETPAQ